MGKAEKRRKGGIWRTPPCVPALLPHLSREPSIPAVSGCEQETVQQQGHLLWERAPLRWPELGMENGNIPSHKWLGSTASVSAVA